MRELHGPLAAAILLVFAPASFAERINQEGRILGALPVVTNSILFDTTNADAVVSAMQIFPLTNPWNECVSNLPVLVNSDAMITQINADVGSSHRVLKLFTEMNFVLVPDNQPLVPFSFFGGYPGDSDMNGGVDPVGLYPIPTNQPVEDVLASSPSCQRIRTVLFKRFGSPPRFTATWVIVVTVPLHQAGLPPIGFEDDVLTVPL